MIEQVNKIRDSNVNGVTHSATYAMICILHIKFASSPTYEIYLDAYTYGLAHFMTPGHYVLYKLYKYINYICFKGDIFMKI